MEHLWWLTLVFMSFSSLFMSFLVRGHSLVTYAKNRNFWPSLPGNTQPYILEHSLPPFINLNCSNLKHPTKQISTQKYFFQHKEEISYTYPKNPKLFERKNFSCPLERTDISPHPKISYNYPKKNNFPCLKKKFLKLSLKHPTQFQKKQIFQTKIVSYNYQKNKEFFILVWKIILLYFHRKFKAFHFRCVLNVEAAI